jgi:hypothetical protein
LGLVWAAWALLIFRKVELVALWVALTPHPAMTLALVAVKCGELLLAQ